MKSGSHGLAMYGLTAYDRDKRNTVSDSDSILTYRKRELISTLFAGR